MIKHIMYLLKSKRCKICKTRFEPTMYGQKTCCKWCRRVNTHLRHKVWQRKNKKKLNSEEYKQKMKKYQKNYHKEYYRK